MPEQSATCETTQLELEPGGELVLLLLSLWPTGARTLLVLTLRATRRAAPSLAWLPGRRVPSARNGDTMVVSIANCALRGRAADHQPPPPVSGHPVDRRMSRSRTTTLVDTRAPVSRQTLAAADSTGKPRLSNTPTTAQAARWWPRTSRRRPHRHLRVEGWRVEPEPTLQKHPEH